MTWKESSISWTDYSGGAANFVLGCTPISLGCKNCYAHRNFRRFGKDFSKVVCSPKKLRGLASTRFPVFSPKRGAPHKPMVFVVNMGDLFHTSVTDEFLLDVFRMFQARPNVVWQVLTKRADRMRRFILKYLAHPYSEFGRCTTKHPWPFPHVWLNVSVESPQYLWRVRELLDTPAAIRGVSLEPLLAPVDLRPWMFDGMGHDNHPKYKRYEYPTGAIDWVVVGGESGPNHRAFNKQWAIDIRNHCIGHTPFFFKQSAGLYPGTDPTLNGQIYQQWPGYKAIRHNNWTQ